MFGRFLASEGQAGNLAANGNEILEYGTFFGVGHVADGRDGRSQVFHHIIRQLGHHLTG